MASEAVTISSDDDDLPLSASVGSHVPVRSAALKTRSLQHCDFCEEVFLNKYDALIHNAKHIIIPLMKRDFHQCPLCLFQFTSRYKLKHHTRNKHKNDIKTQNITSVIKNINITKEKIEKPDVLNKDIKNETNGKHHNIKTIESKETLVTVYISDDEDDLPLKPNANFKEAHAKETEVVKSETDILREALLKDVKVVIEKIELPSMKNELKAEKVLTAEKSEHKINKASEKNEIKIKKVLSPEKSECKVKKLLTPEKNEHKEKKVLTPEKSEHKIKKVPTPAKNDKLSNVKVPENFGLNVKAHNSLIQEHKTVNPVKTPAQNVTNTKATFKANTVPISSRLRFEDDINEFCDDAVMKDLTTECIVDMNLFDEPWFDELAKSINNDDAANDMVISIDDDDDDTAISAANDSSLLKEVLLNGVKDKVVKSDVVYSPSIHHEELVKPGVYRCKKCQQMFPTRFNQIQHEMEHIRIRKPRPFLCEHCDRFLANKKSLKEHITSKHGTNFRPRTFQNCAKCGLRYNNNDRHLEIYHDYLRCHLCNKGFQTEIDRLNHIRGHLVKIKCAHCDFVASELEILEHSRFHKAAVSSKTIIKLCDVCCLFLKNTQKFQYVFGESVSVLGSRMDCDHCGNMFFHLTQVRRTVRGRKPETEKVEREKKKVLTNEERLKNIQQRLKMINKLSRF